MDDGRAGVCLFPTYIYVSKTLTNDENDGDLQQQHVMDDVGGGELGSGRWRHSRGLRSVRHGRRYHVLLAYVKAANYSELVCESPMLLQYGKDQREDHGGKEQKERERSRTFVARESSIFGASAAVVRCSPANSNWARVARPMMMGR
jgi:hypothetical protein